MASQDINDYIAGITSNQDTEQAALQKALLDNLSTYDINKKTAQSLGIMGNIAKIPGVGLATNILSKLAIPGNIIRGGLFEATGNATPEMQNVSGLDEFLKLATGKLHPGFGKTRLLQTSPNDNLITRFAKMGTALTGDVLTDPLSFMGAAAPLSRTAKAEHLVRAILADAPVEGVTPLAEKLFNLHPKPSELMTSLADKNRTSILAKKQFDLNIKPATGTPRDLVGKDLTNPFLDETASSDVLARQYLANHLSQGLLDGGQPEVLRRLAEVYGSKEAAVEAWKLLPEDFKGGLVATSPLGTPIKDANGQFIRITPGTGEMLGPLGGLLNRARLGGAVAKNVITRNTGIAGQIRGNVVKNLWNKEEHLVGNDRFIDYVGYKDSIKAREKSIMDASNEVIKNATFASHQRKMAEEKGFTKEQFGERYSLAYHSPVEYKASHTLTEGLDENPGLATTLEDYAYVSAHNLRQAINILREQANAIGMDIGLIGDPDTYVPLILKDDAKKELLKTERGRINESDFSTMWGRLRYMFATQNQEEGFKKGFPSRLETKEEIAKRLKRKGYTQEQVDAMIDETPAERINPDVWYNNPIEANRIENEMDPTFGMDKFETDPTKIYLHYANDLMNKIATRKMVEVMQSFGMVTKDVEKIAKEVNAMTANTLLAGLMKLSGNDVLSKVYDTRVAKIKEGLADVLDSTKLENLQKEMQDVRQRTAIRLTEAENKQDVAKSALQAAKAEVNKTAPKITKNVVELTKFEKDLLLKRENINKATTIVNSINAKLKKLGKVEDFHKEYMRILHIELKKLGKSGGDKEFRKAIRDELKKVNESIIHNDGEINPLSIESIMADAELTIVRAERKLLIEAKATTEVAKVNAYVTALEKRQEAYKALEDVKNERILARKEYNSAAQIQLIDNVNSIETIVHDYIYTDNSAKKFRYDTMYDTMRYKKQELDKINAIRYQNTPEVIKELEDLLKIKVKEFSAQREAEAKALEKAASEKLQLIKDTLGSTRNTRFGGAIGTYVSHVLDAARKLSKEQYQAYKLIKSEDDIRTLIAHIQENATDDTIAGQAYGDIVKTYDSIRNYIPREYFDDFAVLQRNVLGFKSIADLRNSLFREKFSASDFGKTLKDEGMQILGFNKATQDMYTSTGVNDLLEQMFLVKNNPAKFEKYINDIADPLLNVWKWSVTLGRGPGFVINNLLGGVTMNHIFGVTVKNHIDAANDITTFHSLVTKEVKDHPEFSYPENFKRAQLKMFKASPERFKYFLEFMDRGGITGTESAATIKALQEKGIETSNTVLQGGVPNAVIFSTEPANRAEEMFRNTLNKVYSFEIAKLFTDMGQMSEVFNRYAAFLNGVERFGDYKSAMDRVHLIHFDYSDLSKMEVWARRAVPFYTWVRNNVPAQIRVIGMNTGKIQKFMYANEEFKNQFGADESWMQQVLPEFITNQNGWASRFKFGGNNIGFFLRLPVEDLNRLFSSKGVPDLANAASMLGPTFKTPYEVATGSNLNTGQGANPAGESAAGYYNLLRFIPGAVKSTTGGDTRISSGLSRFVQDLFPLVNTGERLAAGAAALIPGQQPNILFSQNQQNAGISNILNVTGLGAAGGVSTVTITPGTLTAEVKRRTALQNADIRAVAASGNYDTAWIRQQLRLGYTPEQVAVMLESGMGQLAAATNPNITDAATQKYTSALMGLGG